MSLDWEGDKVKKKMLDAIKRGIDATMSAAVTYSKQNRFRTGAGKESPIAGILTTRTSLLEGSIRPVVAAKVERDEVIGVWGSVDVLYAIFHEIGSPGGLIPKRPFLRPAADAEYPKLSMRIKRAFS